MANEGPHRKVDHGYAWVILVVCVCANSFQNIGYPGIFYMDILNQYDRGEYFVFYVKPVGTFDYLAVSHRK